MSSTDQHHPPGWLTRFRHGVGSGAVLLLIALGCCAIPSYAAWLMPGSDSSSAVSPLKVAALVLLAAGHGGVVLAGTPITLVPLLVTVGLGWLVAGHARRLTSWSGFAGMAVGYAAASGVLAGWSRLGSTHAPVLPSMTAGLVFLLAVGGAARSAGDVWNRIPVRWRQVSRAAALVAAGYLVAGSLLSAGMLIAHFSDAVTLQRQLAPGAAGLPVALLGISAVPNAVLASVGYLTGPGFDIGTSTSVSAFGVSSGRLPVFPLLAGLPHHRPAAWLAVLTLLVPALLAGWAVLRTVPAAQRSWTDRLTDCAAAAALAGLLLAVPTWLAAGDLGRNALRGVGADWWAVGLSTAVLVLLAATAWLGVEAARGRLAESGRPGLYALRSEPADGQADDRAESQASDHAEDEAEKTGSQRQHLLDEPATRSRTAS